MRKIVMAVYVLVASAIVCFQGVTVYYANFHHWPHQNVPFAATYFGHDKLMEEWLSNGGDPNASSEGWPLICIAVDSPKGNAATVDVLLRHGADPNGIVKGTGSNGIVNGVEISAFILAAYNSFADLQYIHLLAAYGANIDCRSSEGRTLVEIIAGRNASAEDRRYAEMVFNHIRTIAAQYQESRGIATHALKKP